jgi:hypothetical protein
MPAKPLLADLQRISNHAASQSARYNTHMQHLTLLRPSSAALHLCICILPLPMQVLTQRQIFTMTTILTPGLSQSPWQSLVAASQPAVPESLRRKGFVSLPLVSG